MEALVERRRRAPYKSNPAPAWKETYRQMPDELAVLEEIQQELMLQEQLVREEYEQSLRFDEECLNAMLDGFDVEGKVVCPVCRRHNLAVKSNLVACLCGLSIDTLNPTLESQLQLLDDSIQHNIEGPGDWWSWLTSWLPSPTWFRSLLLGFLAFCFMLLLTCCCIQFLPLLCKPCVLEPAQPTEIPLTAVTKI